MDYFALRAFSFNKEYALTNIGIIFLIYFLYILLFLISDKRKQVGVGLFLALLCYHTAISMYFYGIADSIGYYNVASSMGSLTSYWGNYDIAFMYSILFVLIHYLKLTFLSCTLIFNLMGFSGLIFFYLALLDYFKMETGKDKYLKYFLFFPTLSVWTGFAGKDAIVFLAIGMILYSLVNIKKRALFCIVALILLLHVRPYMFLIVVVAFLLASIFSKGSSLVTKTVLLAFSIGLLVLGHNIFLEKQHIDVTNIGQTEEFIEASQGAWGGGSDVDISNYNILFKVLTFLYRPFFVDVHSLMMLFSSIENLMLLIMTLCFFRPRFYKVIFAEKSLFGRFNLFFFIVATILLASATANLGTMERKKIVVTLSMISLATIYYNKFGIKKEVELRNENLKVASSGPL